MILGPVTLQSLASSLSETNCSIDSRAISGCVVSTFRPEDWPTDDFAVAIQLDRLFRVTSPIVFGLVVVGCDVLQVPRDIETVVWSDLPKPLDEDWERLELHDVIVLNLKASEFYDS
jgi:hypothetical protein